MHKLSRILVAGGHRGLLGTAIVRQLTNLGYENIFAPSPEELDYRNKLQVEEWFEKNRPEYVFQVAAKLIGLLSQDHGETILYNLEIQNNLFDCARRFECKKLLFTGSSCAYPKLSNNPIKEDQLLSGQLDPATESYSIAKIAGIKMAQYFRDQWGCNFISVMPVNLFGPNDTFDSVNAHVMSDFVSKFVQAQHFGHDHVTLWGDGQQVRDFMYVDDAASACIFCMHNYNSGIPINISSGQPMDLQTVSSMVKTITNYQGKIIWDITKPNTIPIKILDNTKLKNLGWQTHTSLEQGIRLTVDWYKENFLK